MARSGRDVRQNAREDAAQPTKLLHIREMPEIQAVRIYLRAADTETGKRRYQPEQWVTRNKTECA